MQSQCESIVQLYGRSYHHSRRKIQRRRQQHDESPHGPFSSPFLRPSVADVYHVIPRGRELGEGEIGILFVYDQKQKADLFFANFRLPPLFEVLIHSISITDTSAIVFDLLRVPNDGNDDDDKMHQTWWLDRLFRAARTALLAGWAVCDTTTPSSKHDDDAAATTRPPPTVPAVAPKRHVTDILIVGAGAAGWSAARTLQEKLPNDDDDDDYQITILESRNHAGGRVDSFSFQGLTLQKGANWITANTTMARLVAEAQLLACPDNFLNATVYELECSPSHDTRTTALKKKLRRKLGHHKKKENGLPHLDTSQCTAKEASPVKARRHIEKFTQRVIPCINHDTEGIWDDDVVDDDFKDIGLKKAYKDCGWKKGHPLDDWLKWVWQDYEFATKDGSLYSWVDSVDVQSFFVKDDWSQYFRRRLDELQQQRQTGKAKVDLELQRRVTTVQYDLQGLKDSPHIRAKVTAVDTTTGELHEYFARRVILTVSAGVYNHDLIQFVPPLKYSDADYNPLRIQQYVKIFYHFPQRFWPNNVDYLYTIDKSHHDEVRSWQNLDRPDLFPGSRILLLTLTSEGLDAVLGKHGDKDLSVDSLTALTDSLQVAFGDDFVAHDDVAFNTFHKDPDFGYGAYSQWKKGDSVERYYHFWGGYDFHEYVKPCHHNGCNKDKEWVVFLSGTNIW